VISITKQKVFSFEGGSANAAAIDGMTGKIIHIVKLPEFATSYEKGRIF